jgi:hypothetical protein
MDSCQPPVPAQIGTDPPELEIEPFQSAIADPLLGYWIGGLTVHHVPLHRGDVGVRPEEVDVIIENIVPIWIVEAIDVDHPDASTTISSVATFGIGAVESLGAACPEVTDATMERAKDKTMLAKQRYRHREDMLDDKQGEMV